ncbi:hypothetical protein BC629DRAFT_254892 [Irpex lacteus]|nr:hypothetical protein BC629DRAFT_254892 [Irpex lacteus]
MHENGRYHIAVSGLTGYNKGFITSLASTGRHNKSLVGDQDYRREPTTGSEDVAPPRGLPLLAFLTSAVMRETWSGVSWAARDWMLDADAPSRLRPSIERTWSRVGPKIPESRSMTGSSCRVSRGIESEASRLASGEAGRPKIEERSGAPGGAGAAGGAAGGALSVFAAAANGRGAATTTVAKDAIAAIDAQEEETRMVMCRTRREG